MEINCKSYDRVKDNIRALSNKSWWVSINKDEEVLLRFLNTVRTNKRSGTVTIKFHEDMLPYLQELNAQNPYTRYKLFYIMTMKSQYSMRLYELLKSVEKLGCWSFSIAKGSRTSFNPLLSERKKEVTPYGERAFCLWRR